jgi:uncharacterized protein YbjT (DUF2867 family)
MKKHALIAGGTGLIGKQLCSLLASNNDYKKVTSLVRKKSDAPPDQLTELIVDFDKLEDQTLPEPVDEAFCCLGTTMKKAGSKAAFHKVDFDYVMAFAKLALANGAKAFFVVTSMGADKKSMFYYNQVKGEIEEALAELKFSSLHIFRPSMLLGDRQEERTGESIGKTVFSILNPIIPSNYKGIEGEQVAKGMISQAKADLKGKQIHESGAIRKMA